MDQFSNYSKSSSPSSLERELEETKKQLNQYKFSSDSFERRVLDLQKEVAKKDEEIKKLIDKYEKVSDIVPSKTLSQFAGENDESTTFRKLFVGGLAYNVTDEILSKYFKKFGTVVDAIVMKDSETKKSRGFGFIVYSHSSMVDAAQAARPHKINDKEVETKRAFPKANLLENSLAVASNIHPYTSKNLGDLQMRRIFVGGIKSLTEKTTIEDYFKQFGEVESVNVIEDSKNHRNRGFAYVTFIDTDVADKVILQKYHMIDSRRCEVKPAFSKIKQANTYGNEIDSKKDNRFTNELIFNDSFTNDFSMNDSSFLSDSHFNNMLSNYQQLPAPKLTFLSMEHSGWRQPISHTKNVQQNQFCSSSYNTGFMHVNHNMNNVFQSNGNGSCSHHCHNTNYCNNSLPFNGLEANECFNMHTAQVTVRPIKNKGYFLKSNGPY